MQPRTNQDGFELAPVLWMNSKTAVDRYGAEAARIRTTPDNSVIVIHDAMPVGIESGEPTEDVVRALIRAYEACAIYAAIAKHKRILRDAARKT